MQLALTVIVQLLKIGTIQYCHGIPLCTKLGHDDTTNYRGIVMLHPTCECYMRTFETQRVPQHVKVCTAL